MAPLEEEVKDELAAREGVKNKVAGGISDSDGARDCDFVDESEAEGT